MGGRKNKVVASSFLKYTLIRRLSAQGGAQSRFRACVKNEDDPSSLPTPRLFYSPRLIRRA